MSRKRNRRPLGAGGVPVWRRIAIATAIGVVGQLVFLFAYQTILAEHCARRAQQAEAAKRPPLAGQWAQRSLAMNPRQGYAAFFLGVAEREQGRNAQAAAAFQRAVATMPHRAGPLSELAACEEKLGNVAAAADHLAEALAIEPLPADGGAPRARLGRLLFAQGHWADGVACFRAGVADSPQSRFLFDGLTVGYDRLRLPALAVASALALLESPQFAARACEHLLRFARDPASRPTIVALTQAVERGLRPDDPRRSAITNLVKSLAAEP